MRPIPRDGSFDKRSRSSINSFDFPLFTGNFNENETTFIDNDQLIDQNSVFEQDNAQTVPSHTFNISIPNSNSSDGAGTKMYRRFKNNDLSEIEFADGYFDKSFGMISLL